MCEKFHQVIKAHRKKFSGTSFHWTFNLSQSYNKFFIDIKMSLWDYYRLCRVHAGDCRPNKEHWIPGARFINICELPSVDTWKLLAFSVKLILLKSETILQILMQTLYRCLFFFFCSWDLASLSGFTPFCYLVSTKLFMGLWQKFCFTRASINMYNKSNEEVLFLSNIFTS